MLKHLPEGLVPFADCGFARRPVHPLEGEKVSVYVRTDETDGAPRLLLWVNDIASPPPQAGRIDSRHWSFSLGAFSFGDRVSYRICTDREESRLFSFMPERVTESETPLGLFRDGNLFYLAFEGFYAAIESGHILTMIYKQGAPPAGVPALDTQVALPEGYSLSLTGNKKCFQLKRLSVQGEPETVVSIDKLSLRRTPDGHITEITQHGTLKSRYIWGTGERFDSVNQRRGGTHGRVTEKFTQQGDQTYLPIPFFMTEQGVGCWREGSIPAEMHFGDGLTIRQRVKGEVMAREVWFFGSPAEILRQFIDCTGQPVLPPDWAFGVWMSANGWDCDREVDAQLSAISRYDYPADVMVLEAWSDERTFYRWNDAAHWPDPSSTVRRIRNAGLHLILWQIPIIKYEWGGMPGVFLEEDETEAIDRGYCVMNEDGTPYRITENWFHNSLLLDFTNPEAVKWWFSKRQYLLDMGVEGFKTDGGEFLFDETARLHNGMTGLEAHNLYPAQYIASYHDFMRQNGVNGITFSRADYVGVQTRPLHWAGDQLSLWSELRAQLKAGLSAGLSGVLFWGFDIGGFAGELPSAELYLRSTALACFSPIMQWHAEPRSGQFYATHGESYNNDRSPWNLAEKLDDPRLLEIACRFARIRKELKPYLAKEAAWCVRAGRPLMAHLCLDFPEDETACACEDEFMLGRKFLVCPIVEEGSFSRNVWLPRGRWRHFFSGVCEEGNRWVSMACPIEEIIVLERMSDSDEAADQILVD